MAKYQKEARDISIVAVGTLLAAILGYGLQALMAYYFGASQVTDAYIMAQTVPNIFTKILQTNTLAIVFMPIFLSYMLKGRKEDAWKIANNIFTLVGLTFLVVIIAGMAIAPLLVNLLAPGFDEATTALTIQLTYIVFPIVFFTVLSGLAISILQSFKKFTLPSVIRLLTPTLSIIVLIGFVQLIGIFTLALAALAAAIIQFVILWLALFQHGFRFQPIASIRNPVVKQLVGLLIPFIFVAIVAQLQTVVGRVLASLLSEGSVSSLEYAARLISNISRILLVAIPTVAFPSFIAQITRGDYNKLAKSVSRTIRLTALVVFPTTIGLMVLGVPIVRVLFQRGEFDLADTRSTAFALIFLAIGLFAMGVNGIFSGVFYALKDTKTLAKISIIALLGNIVLSLLLFKPLNVGGLALASSVGHIIAMLGMYWALKKRRPEFKSLFQPKYFGTILLGAITVGLTSWLVFAGVSNLIQLTDFGDYLLAVSTAILAGLLIYTFLLSLFKIEEFRIVIAILTKK